KYDGACEEGPSYWSHAYGKLYEYLQLLSYATDENLPVFEETMIRNMGEYIAHSYIGEGWVVNFADASAKGSPPEGLIFRYGKAVGSELMQSFASYLYHRDQGEDYYFAKNDVFQTLENLLTKPSIIDKEPSLPANLNVWYPQTEFCYIRQPRGLFFAGKGGFNAESHNHNDVGSFVLYYNHHPLFIDVGVGTYTRKTFSSERYSIWTMQSNYHNLPFVNGFAQENGREYKSSQVVFDEQKSLFSIDIAKAYPAEAGIKKWTRSYQVVSEKKFKITDDFILQNASVPNQLNFMTACEPMISEDGEITIPLGKKNALLIYNPDEFEANVEVINVDDQLLSRVWGGLLYRLSLTARKLEANGEYSFLVDIH
ncbi:MAG TPA: heparinase II/III family protein, partial [Bacteroidales bacterium]|nr:heparinase II/III family protein [Bacteroidales bacterium]